MKQRVSEMLDRLAAVAEGLLYRAVVADQATPHYARVVAEHTPEETGAVPPRSS